MVQVAILGVLGAQEACSSHCCQELGNLLDLSKKPVQVVLEEN